MSVKDNRKPGKIVDLDTARKSKTATTAQLLRNTRKVARAISDRTCLICLNKKSCVNKTGVCAYCFDNVLTQREQVIAQEEAKHKVIKLDVQDDRWPHG